MVQQQFFTNADFSGWVIYLSVIEVSNDPDFFMKFEFPIFPFFPVFEDFALEN